MMNYVKICPTCKETIVSTRLIDILITYREDLTGNEIYEQGWHKACYQAANAALVEALKMVQSRVGIGGVVYFTGAELDQIDAALARVEAAAEEGE